MSDYKTSAFHQNNQPSSSGGGPTSSTSRTEPKVGAGAGSVENVQSSFYVSSAPVLNMPKGGGALKTIDEKLEVNPITGTCSLGVPLSITPGRGGLTPEISLSYDSGFGNGILGIGWRLSLPIITRKTSQGIPKYDDPRESDIFLINGLEDLVPKLASPNANSSQFLETPRGDYMVRQYWPRTEGSFILIERWANTKNMTDVYWRTISKNNTTSIYGQSSNSRIFDPSDGRIFSWLICASYDSRGNAIIYSYKEEDSVGVAIDRACEKHRSDISRSINRYIKSIQYGNRQPNRDNNWNVVLPKIDDQWMFQIVFDYGDHSGEFPTSVPNLAWKSRQDPFSSYVAGFEIRTQRLCHRILMFHHLKEELGVDDYLISSTELFYDKSPITTHLSKILQTGYTLDKSKAGMAYTSKSLPPLIFKYSEVSITDATVKNIDLESVENLPVGLSDSYKWIDIEGEGKPSLLYTKPGAWYKKRNASLYQVLYNDDAVSNGGNLLLDATEIVMQIPNADAGSNFADVDGNGNLDLITQSSGRYGFYERTDENGWTEFKPFPSWPTLNLSDPNLRYLDLTGDGKADLVLSEGDAFLWYPAIGAEGYAPGIRSYSGKGDNCAPRIIFGDPTETIYLADFTGDGLTDVVRIRNGDICYWPNLGYGRFGRKVTMDNAPWLDATESFSYNRILLGDIDGSGVADLLYFPPDGGINIHTNLAGNSWETPYSVNFPQMDSLANVQLVDLFGTGTLSLVWSTKLPGYQRSSLQYFDFMRSLKPHLLKKYFKGPLEVRMEYTPSSQYAQDDRNANMAWPTKLPFPVQCLSELATYDYISGNYSVTTYNYHYGFYDGVEREFRGFGMIEILESEHYLVSNGKTFPTSPLGGLSTPDTRTVKWYSTGSYFESSSVTDAFKARFYKDPSLQQPYLSLQDPVITPVSMSGEEFRQAYRSLKGSLLREEIYQADGTEKSNVPVAITDYNYSTSMLQGCQSCHPGVFLVSAREILYIQLERNPSDARLKHHLNLEYDTFGNVTKSIDVHYGRTNGPFTSKNTAEDLAIQGTSVTTYQEQDFTNNVTGHDDYLAPLPAENRQYQVTGVAPTASSGLFTLADFAVDPSTGRSRIDDLPLKNYLMDDSTKGLRLIARKQTRYRSNSLSKILSTGAVESLALIAESYSLSMSPAIFLNAFQNNKNSQLLADPTTLRGTGDDGAGYVELDQDNQLWIPSGQQRMSADINSSPADELDSARKSFFTPVLFLDPFVQTQGRQAISHFRRATYDSYYLRPTQVVDEIQNVRKCSYDYARLQPSVVTDDNGNSEGFLYDELGALTYHAVMGKPSVPTGDSLDELKPPLTHAEMLVFMSDPLNFAKSFLGDATSYTFCDFPTFTKGQGFSPGFEVSIQRDTHVNEAASKGSQLLLDISYFDGRGRVISRKQLAEPDSDKREWIAKDFSIYNQNGDVVQKFEPAYEESHFFTQPTGSMVVTSFYDGLHRLVAKLMPDQTWTKTVYSAWANVIYDVGDTVLLDPLKDTDVSPYFSCLGSTTPMSYWLANHTALKDPLQQAAIVQSKIYANTPTELWLDALGRAYRKILDNGNNELYATRTFLDIQNNPKQIEDSKGRIVSTFEYDMVGNCLHSASMESGEKWTVMDVSGQELYAWDSRKTRKRHSYDAARRETKLFIQSDQTPEYLAELIDYGEGQENDVMNNLRGRVFRVSDQSGTITSSAYDCNGNTMRILRRFTKEYKNVVDWQGTILMEDQAFASSKTYNALNMILSHTRPDGNTQTNIYDVRGQLFSVQGTSGILPGTAFISSIQYDAKGDEINIVYGNNTTCVMDYDPATFHLTSKQTRRGNTSLQSLQYTRDIMGNITHIDDASQQDLFFRGNIVHPSQDFTYDALGRLLTATGREHLGQSGTNWTSIPFSSVSGAATTNSPADATAMGTYIETYAHDSEGNIMSVVHSLTDKTTPGWTRSYNYSEPSALEPTKFSNRLSSTTVGNETSNYKYEGPTGLQGLMSSMSGFPLMQWDPQNQLQATSTQIVTHGQTPEITWYRYNHSGKRVRKVTERLATAGTTPVRSKDHLYMDEYEIFTKFGGDGATVVSQIETMHIMGGETRIALVEADTDTAVDSLVKTVLVRYAINDHLSSVSLELDDKGQLLSQEEFSPFGSTTFIATGQLQVPKRYRFSAKERDVETGLYYFEKRYLMVWLGRWLSPDPIGLSGGMNLFQYVGGDPINYVDPRGTCPVPARIQARLDLIEANFAESQTRTYRANYIPRFYAVRDDKERLQAEVVNAQGLFHQASHLVGLFRPMLDLEGRATEATAASEEFLDHPSYAALQAAEQRLNVLVGDLRLNAALSSRAYRDFVAGRGDPLISVALFRNQSAEFAAFEENQVLYARERAAFEQLLRGIEGLGGSGPTTQRIDPAIGHARTAAREFNTGYHREMARIMSALGHANGPPILRGRWAERGPWQPPAAPEDQSPRGPMEH